MERLDFSEHTPYSAIEASIHMNRYLSAKKYIVGKRVLDVACGEGYGSKLLKAWGAKEVVGVDISSEAIAKANKNFAGEDGLTFLQHTCEQLPFEPDSFDVVVSFETIEHVDNPNQFLQEIARVLRFNGTAIISCPNDYAYEEHVENFSNPYHKHRWRFFEFKELCERYLGTGAAWYLGFALNGFSNMPVEDCSFPEKDSRPTNMLGMMSYHALSQALWVCSDRFLNYWNANYYIGVWNGNSGQYQAVMFARETFIDPADHTWVDIQDAYQENQELQSAMTAKYNKKEQEVCNLMQQLHVTQIEKDRISRLLQLAQEEKTYLWERINRYEQQINVMRPEYEYFQMFKSYRTYRVIQFYYKLKNKIKRLFGK